MSQQPDPVTGTEPVSDPAVDDEVAAAVVGAFPADTDDPAAPDGPHDALGPAHAGEDYRSDEDAEATETDGADAPPEDPRTREELLVAVTDAERQRDEYLDDLRRARADFENFRRRTQREAGTARDAGRGDVAVALLDVLDDLDRTLDAAEASSDESLAKGVSLVAEKLVGTLKGLGLARLEPTGEVFDPALHEAVQQVAAEEPVDAPVVAETLRPGYQLGDRVLRPAMVVVKG